MTLPGCSPLCSRSQNPDLNRTVPDNVPITIILPDEMLSVDWAEADIPIIKGYLKSIDRGAKAYRKT
jgi:hypothetical protein